MYIGQILCGTYCYSSIFPIFLRVTKCTPTSVYVEKLNKHFISSDGYGQNGDVMPTLDGDAHKIAKRFKIHTSKYGEYIKYDEIHCSEWDGTAQMVCSD